MKKFKFVDNRCYGVPGKMCSCICQMWVHDDRCPNFDWLGPYKSDEYRKRASAKDRPKGKIRIE